MIKASAGVLFLLSGIFIAFVASVTKKMQQSMDKDSIIVKSDVDKCQYRYVVLPNQLKVTLISDPTLDNASAALDVHVGSFSDPADTPGLAHFLEHLLFMGTKKYPQENDYNQFLSDHGGWSNAFTSDEHTNYFFEVNAEHLEGALDRFAQFFIEPLFGAGSEGMGEESGTQREMKAVHSEHSKNVKNDHWRMHQLDRDLSDPKHPYSKFGTGTLETLNKPHIVETLKEFYHKHYSANIMCLVVYGKNTLDEMEKMVNEMFSAVPNQTQQVPKWDPKPWLPENYGTLITMKAVKEMRSLNIAFPVPDMQSHYRIKPYNYLSHLLGHEGPTGLLAFLKRWDWALELSAGSEEDYSGFSFFEVGIELTPKGLKEYKEVIKAVFQYIRLMSQVGPQEWVFEECKQLAEMEFRFKDKSHSSSIAYKLAGWMHQYPPEHFLKGHMMMDEYKPELLRTTLSHLREDNFRAMLVLSEVNAKGFEKEKWYGTKYKVEKMDLEFLSNLAANEELQLPAKNEFIPKDLQVISSLKPKPQVPTKQGALTYKLDDTFGLPKAVAQLVVRTDLYKSVKEHVALALWTEMFSDSLTELAYDADLAGLEVKLQLVPEGVELKFIGFHDKLPLLVERVVSRMVKPLPNMEMFASIKEKYLRNLKSLEQEGSEWHAGYLAGGSLLEKFIHYSDKLGEAEKLVEGDLPKLLDLEYSLEALIMGNISEERAKELFDQIKSFFPTAKDFVRPPKSVVLKSGDVTLVPEKPSPQPNNAIELYVQTGLQSDTRMRALTRYYWQLFHESFFDTLRTKEQLGYITTLQIRERSQIIGYRFLIQSHRTPLYLEERIVKFLEGEVKQRLETISAEELKKNAQALHSILTEKPKKLKEEAKTYWDAIKEAKYDFDAVRQDAQAVLDMSAEELRKGAQEVFETYKSNSLVVHVWSEANQADMDYTTYSRKVVHRVQDIDKSHLAPLSSN